MCNDWDGNKICTPMTYATEDLDKYELTFYYVKYFQDQAIVFITFLISLS